MWFQSHLICTTLTPPHLFLVCNILNIQIWIQLSEKPILRRQLLIHSLPNNIPHNAQDLVGVVRFCRRYTPRSWRLEQEAQWPACVTVKPDASHSSFLWKLLKEQELYYIYLCSKCFIKTSTNIFCFHWQDQHCPTIWCRTHHQGMDHLVDCLDCHTDHPVQDQHSLELDPPVKLETRVFETSLQVLLCLVHISLQCCSELCSLLDGKYFVVK